MFSQSERSAKRAFGIIGTICMRGERSYDGIEQSRFSDVRQANDTSPQAHAYARTRNGERSSTLPREKKRRRGAGCRRGTVARKPQKTRAQSPSYHRHFVASNLARTSEREKQTETESQSERQCLGKAKGRQMARGRHVWNLGL